MPYLMLLWRSINPVFILIISLVEPVNTGSITIRNSYSFNHWQFLYTAELLEKETLSADQVIEIFHDVEKWTNTEKEVDRLVPPGLGHGETTVAAASTDI